MDGGREPDGEREPKGEAALTSDPEPGYGQGTLAERDRAFRRRMPGTGRHEVIVETPRHDRGLETLSPAELLDVLRAYRARYAEAAADARIRHVLIFRNQGTIAGASLVHPHAQLVGLPVVPPLIASIVERCETYAHESGRSLLLDLVAHEIRARRRILEAGDRWVGFLPYAGANAYEVWLAPRAEIRPFERVDDDELLDLARAIRSVLARLSAALGGPDFNVILRTPPVPAEGAARFPWHLQFIPRLTSIAGFEIGVGLRINEVPPEDAAARLRQVEPGAR